MNQKIVFTGGHHNSALVVAKDLKKDGFKVFWFGHKFNFRDKNLSAEYQEVVAEKIPFYELKTGRFYRQFNPIEHLKTVFGIIQSVIYLVQIRPALVVSFGGFLAVPVVVAAWLLRIPSVTHEQTVVAGWANRAIAPFVKKIYLTHPSSLSNFPKGKAEVVGLPMRAELFDPKYKKPFSPPLLYISCGKQGSHTINQAVFPLISELVKNYTVVHQTGSVGRDIDRARRIKDSLGELGQRYQFSPYFLTKDAAVYLQSSEIVVSRAGAHLTYELSLLRKKAVFIPIPWASHDEQRKNAQNASTLTAGVILEEKDLTPDSLSRAIAAVAKMKVKPITSKELDAGINASQKIVNSIHEIISTKN